MGDERRDFDEDQKPDPAPQPPKRLLKEPVQPDVRSEPAPASTPIAQGDED